jgi:radical SAM superfamily enzyme YgiQ (UPF0313 family)
LNADVRGYPVLEEYIKQPVWGPVAKNSSAAPFMSERSLSMVSSRGCPFACKFCFRGAQGERNYGVRTAQNILNEITYDADEHGVDFIGMLDDNFMVQPKRIGLLPAEFQPFMQERGIRWGTHGRLDEAADLRPDNSNNTVKNNSLIRVDEMAKAGCIYIGFGAESASENVLREMGKGGFMLKNGMQETNGYQFPVTMVEGVKRTREAGIYGNLTWIMGYPGETLENLKTTIAFILWQEEYYSSSHAFASLDRQNGKETVNTNLFVATAYPGTEMFKQPVVQEKIHSVFGVSFDSKTKDAIPDNNFYNYVKELDDATKLLEADGAFLNYGHLTDEDFLQAREYVETGELGKILDM